MARNPKQPNGKKPRSEDDALKKLEEIFASDPKEWFRQQSNQNFRNLDAYIKVIGDKFIAELGTSNDYEISYSQPEPIAPNDYNLFIKSIDVWPKPETGLSIGANAGLEPIDDVLRNTSRALEELGLGIEGAMAIVSGVRNRIEKECALYFRFVDGRLRRIDDESENVYRGGVITRLYPVYPNEVKRATGMLGSLGFEFCRTKIRTEIEPLTLPDKKIKIKRRIDRSGPEEYLKALKATLIDVEKEIELEKERKEIHESIKMFDSEERAEANDEGGIPDKFSIKEAMVLVDYLATMPGVWSGSTHRAKAEFLSRLSAHTSPSIDKIENMFSRANFDEIKTNCEGILNVWKERFLPSTKGRKQS